MMPKFKPPRELPILVLLLLLCAVMAKFVPAFGNTSNLTLVGITAALIGILACGEGLVILGGGLDLSVGSILALSGCVAGAAMEAGYSWPLAALAGLAVGALAGVVNGTLITGSVSLPFSSIVAAGAMLAGIPWPLAVLVGLAVGALAGSLYVALISGRMPFAFLNTLVAPLRKWDSQRTDRRIPRPPILTTLATLLLFRNGISLLTHSKSYGPVPDAFYHLGQGLQPFLFFFILVALFAFLTLRTHFGRWTLALGGNEQAVRLSGVATETVKRWTYLLSGLCAGLIGLLTLAFNNTVNAKTGEGEELNAIAACVVGGMRITGGEGSIFGVALGAILIAVLQNALELTKRPKEQHGLIVGGIILIAAILEQWRIMQQQRKGVTA